MVETTCLGQRISTFRDIVVRAGLKPLQVLWQTD